MKKILIYFGGFLMLFFIIPAICTITPSKEPTQETLSTEVSDEDTEPETSNQYDYEKYKTIKLLHPETAQIEELNIDEYLYGVVASEMPASFELEALKAQAVVARTYTIYQTIHNSVKHENADMCDDFNCCQAWISKDERLAKWEQTEAESNWNKIVQAVDSTKGKIVTYEGQPINAFFHANSGGITESSLNIWGGIDYPYLKSVETTGEEGYTQYSSQVILTHQELIDKIRTKYEDCEIDFAQENCIQILEYTTSGRIKTIKFGNKEIAGTEARTLLGLKSTNFTFAIDGKNITFVVTGYGHGVGMSQTGADALAKLGSNYETIVKHFYTNVEITEVNSL
ncbi:MAG: stage II sporulation protein D [Clostridia bacterium]|nr:stage II sporulation protein D [Clostridia bacterium]